MCAILAQINGLLVPLWHGLNMRGAMGEKVERISGSFFRGFTVGGVNILPILTRRVDSLNTPASVDTAGAATYTAAQIGRGIILRDPNGGNRTDTLPTAALLIAGAANVYTLAADGDSVQWEVRNTGAQVLTLAAGSGLTLLGDLVLPAGSTRVLTAIRTSASAATVTVLNPLAAPGQVPVQASTITTASAQTYTAAQYLGGYIARDPNGAARADLVPTAASINTANPALVVGSYFDSTIKNTADAAETITLTANTGVTLIGTITVAQNETMVVRTIKTAAAAFDVVKLG